MIINVMSNPMKKSKNVLSIVAVLLLLLGPGAVAEPGTTQPGTGDPLVDSLSGQTVLQNGQPTTGSGNAGADQISAGVVGNPANVIDTTQTNKSLGREQKAADSATTAGTGKGMAIGTGVTLMSIAIPKLLSLIPSEVATGAALMANAGLEFAQAGVDAGAQDANKAQENLLRKADGQTGQSVDGANAAGKKAVAEQVANAVSANPELAKMLGERGLNSDDFAKKLANGELNTPESVLAATGSTGVDAHALAQGVAAAAEPLGNQNTLRAIQDDKAKDADKPNTEGGGSSDPKFAGGDQKASSKGITADESSSHGSGAKDLLNNLAGAVGKGGAAALDALRNASEGELSSMLAGLMGGGLAAGVSSAEAAAQRLLVKEALAKKGIIKDAGKATIFQLAHRNFRSFQRWRKKVEVAAR